MSAYQSIYTGTQIDNLLSAVNTAVTADGIVNINGLNTILGDYLTSADAANTYLTISDAADTYLTQTNAENTYEPKITKTVNTSLNFTCSTASVAEYMRYSKYGKIVIIDIGGLSLTNGTDRVAINFTNLPIIRNRFVCLLMNDASPGPNIYVGYCYATLNSTTITFHIPNSTRVYGQICYLTD